MASFFFITQNKYTTSNTAPRKKPEISRPFCSQLGTTPNNIVDRAGGVLSLVYIPALYPRSSTPPFLGDDTFIFIFVTWR